MMRLLSIAVLSLLVVACGGSSDDAAPTTGDTDTSLDPTALSVDTPPASGQLPADLRPPV